MAVRNDFTAGEVLAAADLNDTFASKLNLAGGKVLQVVRATDSTQRSTTSTSYVDADLSVTITPQKSDSAIIVLSSVLLAIDASTDSMLSFLQITDSSNNAISGSQGSFLGTASLTGTGTRSFRCVATMLAYATPGTTSATTYKLRFSSQLNTITTTLRNADSTGQLYAIEVSA